MYRCLKCGAIFPNLPKCQCGYEHEIIGGVYQLTDMPNMNIDAELGELYTGYDKIGQYYEGKNWRDLIDDNRQAEYISPLLNGGYLLDVGCGTGTHSLPSALNGDKVIFTDISQVMIELLIEKAKYHNIDMKYITPIRMNGLDLRFADNSIDMVRCDGMLHLTSNSAKILQEIYRVLKPNGKFIVKSSFGEGIDNSINKVNLDELNKQYYERFNYWTGVYYNNVSEYPKTRFGYQFDILAECEKVFGEIEKVEFYNTDRKLITEKLDFQLYRFKNKGFSDQQNIPDDANAAACETADRETKLKYGEDFDQVVHSTYPSEGFYLNVFTK